MPGTRCAVAVCNNSLVKTKQAGMDVKYHQFPKNQYIRNIWIQKCRRGGEWNPNSCHVCSIHFTKNDYKKDAYYIRTKHLRPTAIPTLYLTEASFPSSTPLQLKNRFKKLIDEKMSSDCTNLSDDNLEFEEVSSKSDEKNLFFQPMPVFVSEDLHEEPIQEQKEEEFSDTTSDNRVHMNRDNLKSETGENSLTGSSMSFEVVECENDELSFVVSDDNDLCYDETIDNCCTEESPELKYITVVDNSTQVDENDFIKNYKLLLNRNKSLKKEVLFWKNICKKLSSRA
ncbi:uncharacterized protein LOC106640553 [Copidosoma floridanum]|uniref:uncharacterized protein LOC106640553 n=1 Tax=Copidosoma floridanum TaxID=29053 RepID=UPI0006C945B4|nr:uncharacterized protein LOC106640553 [Copidosoma floridanum]